MYDNENIEFTVSFKEYQNDAFNIDVIDLRNSSLTSSKENESIFNLGKLEKQL